MAVELTQETGTPEVSSEESFEQYEAKFYKARQEETSDAASEEEVAKPAEDSEAEETVTEPEADKASDDEDEEEEEETPKPKGKGGFQRRIDKLTARIKELESGQPAQNAGEPEAQQPVANGKPTLENFDSIESYTEARIQWELNERDRKAEQAKAIEGWNKRQGAARKAHADYDDVLAAADDVKLSAVHQKLFLDSEHGADLAYALAKDRKELEKFAALDPLAAARMYGRLEASLSTTPKEKTPVTRAPKPPSTVAGGKTAAAKSSDELADDYSAWERKRNAELRQQRGW